MHILGQSLGGTIATEIAADYPGKIHSVVLLTSPVRPVSRGWKLGWLATYLWKEAIRANSLNPEIVKTIFNLLPKVRLLVREMIRLNGFNIALAKTKDIDEYGDFFSSCA